MGKPSLEPLAVGVIDAAAMVGVSPRLLWAEIAGGRLRCVRLTGRRRTVIETAELRRWLAAQSHGGADAR